MMLRAIGVLLKHHLLPVANVWTIVIGNGECDRWKWEPIDSCGRERRSSFKIAKMNEVLLGIGIMSIPVLAIVKNGKIEPINPIDLPEGTRLLLLPNPSTEALEWSGLSLAGLSHAYSDDEPDYDLTHLKELNPLYERA